MRFLVITIIIFSATTNGARYNDYKVYSVTAKTEAHNDILENLKERLNFDLWSSLNKVGKPVSVMVSPTTQKKFEENLLQNQIEFEILIHDVEATIQAEKIEFRDLPSDGSITFDKYLQHDQINKYLAQLAKDYPKIVTLQTIGKSYEGRATNLVRISSKRNSAKPAVFIDAGIHAREWIAPATALYLINQLVENPENSYLYEKIDWIIIPSLNPDGYEFSWTQDRLWRKTRSPGKSCIGTDPNRNFDFHWMEAGASQDECDESYAGTKPFSEIETRNLRDYLTKTANIQAYLSLHSYGQYVLYPWSYDEALPDNGKELQTLGESIAAAIKNVGGTEYTVGNTAIVLYKAAGSSQDWAMGGAKINISLTMELPGGGISGFDLPASEIKRVVKETFEGIKVFGQYVANKTAV